MSVKPVFFISDLHLGAGAANDFHRTFELHRFLDYAAEHASELVLLGDIFELLQSELTAVYIQHHEVIQHLFRTAEKIPTAYVIGNHDAIVAVDFDASGRGTFLGSRITVTPTYTNDALRTYAVHGHQYDLVNRHADMLDISEGSSPGDRIARAAGWLEAHVHPQVDALLEQAYIDYKKTLRKLSRDTANYASIVTPAHPAYCQLGGDFSEYTNGAKDILKSERWDVAVMGHTHGALIRQFTKNCDGCDGIYVNTGSWVGDGMAHTPPVFAAISVDRVQLIDAETFEVLDETAREKTANHMYSPQATT